MRTGLGGYYHPEMSSALFNAASQDVAKTGQRGEPLGELQREDSGFPESEDGFVVVSRLLQLLHRDDPVRQVDTGLSSHLEVPLYDVLQVRVLEELTLLFVLERFELEQALIESF